MATMQTSLGTVSYSDKGSGPPVVLLHAALHDRTDFAPVTEALGNGRRVLALDWPGHGESPLPATPLGAVEFGDVLVEFADQLDLSNAVIVGNSVGGYAACRLALERPDRVAGVVLVNNGGFTPHTVFTRLFCAVMGKPAVVKAVFPLSVRAYMRGKSTTDDAVIARVTARAKTADGARTAAALWKSFTEPGHDLRARAAQIGAPVLITWGSKDLTAPLRWGEAVHAAIPGSSFEALPTGHVVFSSEPEAWLAKVLPFVDAAQGVRKGLRA
ncbi:alpha/beta fold hydrolase [Mycolicibacterium moriokaense]|uniref:Pimeloyl-ACP methyl ester carboxylesterase n=1 Tax=Mycolicibacterium moriokaense TaxID=39691 RepID=A0A318HK39_9MYCO|nr:alpha/beta fold hydrolase [Mycolicibacterium moriokaense]PXX11184.1 pimeloyl-ACP methyl ester carboxylesterase [Mycolicibacterium moriokaense]